MPLKPNTFYESKGGTPPYNMYFVDSDLVQRNVLSGDVKHYYSNELMEVLNPAERAELLTRLANDSKSVASRMKQKLSELEQKTQLPIDPFAPRPADAPPLRPANNRAITTGPPDEK